MDATEMTFTTDGFRLGTDAQEVLTAAPLCVRGTHVRLWRFHDVAADGVVLSGDRWPCA
jgi:hypothetical protein